MLRAHEFRSGAAALHATDPRIVPRQAFELARGGRRSPDVSLDLLDGREEDPAIVLPDVAASAREPAAPKAHATTRSTADELVGDRVTELVAEKRPPHHGVQTLGPEMNGSTARIVAPSPATAVAWAAFLLDHAYRAHPHPPRHVVRDRLRGSSTTTSCFRRSAHARHTRTNGLR